MYDKRIAASGMRQPLRWRKEWKEVLGTTLCHLLIFIKNERINIGEVFLEKKKKIINPAADP